MHHGCLLRDPPSSDRLFRVGSGDPQVVARGGPVFVAFRRRLQFEKDIERFRIFRILRGSSRRRASAPIHRDLAIVRTSSSSRFALTGSRCHGGRTPIGPNQAREIDV